MQIRCISNNLSGLPAKLRSYAFTQDEKGKLDLTLDHIYTVYGLRSNAEGKFFLVLTDTLNTKLPWWMPADLFEVVDDEKPSDWETKSLGLLKKDRITANPSYFDAVEDIEDGTGRGYEVFQKMKNDNLYHPSEFTDTSSWLICHATIGALRYDAVGKPFVFTSAIAPEWFAETSEEDMEDVWDEQDKYIRASLEWLQSKGITSARVSDLAGNADKQKLEVFSLDSEGYFTWSSDVLDILPSINFYELVLKAEDGSEIIIFESDTQTLFVKDPRNDFPESLRQPTFSK
jgi:hypothetical protein